MKIYNSNHGRGETERVMGGKRNHYRIGGSEFFVLSRDSRAFLFDNWSPRPSDCKLFLTEGFWTRIKVASASVKPQDGKEIDDNFLERKKLPIAGFPRPGRDWPSQRHTVSIQIGSSLCAAFIVQFSLSKRSSGPDQRQFSTQKRQEEAPTPDERITVNIFNVWWVQYAVDVEQFLSHMAKSSAKDDRTSTLRALFFLFSSWNRFRLEFQHLKLFKYKSLATYASARIIHTRTTYLSNVYKSKSAS